MPKNTSISLGDHFEGFIQRQIRSGRYGPASSGIEISGAFRSQVEACGK